MTEDARPAWMRVPYFAAAVARRFYNDGCLLHASALAYTSVLSLVPLLALMFAILKGLGVQRRLEPLLLSRLALSPEVTGYVIEYIDRTNVGTLGVIGAIALLLTVLSVLGQIEASLNVIWRVRQSRTWLRKATDYLSAVLVTPFLLLGAVALTSALEQQTLLQMLLQTQYIGDALLLALYVAPVLMNAIALAILYAAMPNRRPYAPAILVGALVAGYSWQLVHWGYVALGIGVTHYGAIYGTISQLPITLVWIYVSWMVVLAGAEVAAVYEFGAEDVLEKRGPLSCWAIALHVLLRAAEGFRAGTAVHPRALARELRVDTDVVARIAEQLQQAGLLAAVVNASETYILARDAQRIEVSALDGVLNEVAAPAGCDPRVKALLDSAQREGRRILHEYRLADLLARQEEPPAAGRFLRS